MSLLPVIDCDGCGACCMEQESPPMYLYILQCIERGESVAEDDEDVARVKALPDDLRDELFAYRDHLSKHKRHPNRGVCIWFDVTTRQCKHYDRRPSICRDVKLGDAGCLAWREKYEMLLR